MATNYTWNCRTVDTYPTLQENADVVYNVHWRITATDEETEMSTSSIGTQAIGTEDMEDFTVFSDLTHEVIIEWVESAMGEDGVALLKEGLDSSLASLITPTSVTKYIEDEVIVE